MESIDTAKVRANINGARTDAWEQMATKWQEVTELALEKLRETCTHRDALLSELADTKAKLARTDDILAQTQATSAGNAEATNRIIGEVREALGCKQHDDVVAKAKLIGADISLARADKGASWQTVMRCREAMSLTPAQTLLTSVTDMVEEVKQLRARVRSEPSRTEEFNMGDADQEIARLRGLCNNLEQRAVAAEADFKNAESRANHNFHFANEWEAKARAAHVELNAAHAKLAERIIPTPETNASELAKIKEWLDQALPAKRQFSAVYQVQDILLERKRLRDELKQIVDALPIDRLGEARELPALARVKSLMASRDQWRKEQSVAAAAAEHNAKVADGAQSRCAMMEEYARSLNEKLAMLPADISDNTLQSELDKADYGEEAALARRLLRGDFNFAPTPGIVWKQAPFGTEGPLVDPTVTAEEVKSAMNSQTEQSKRFEAKPSQELLDTVFGGGK